MRPTLLSVLALLAACASPPNAEDVARADLGPAPDIDRATAWIHGYFRESLKDPESARISIGQVERNWYMTSRFSSPRFAWLIRVSCNAKNSYGGYTGSKPYYFYFLGDTNVAIGTTFELTSGDVYGVVEFDGGGRTAEQAGLSRQLDR